MIQSGERSASLPPSTLTYETQVSAMCMAVGGQTHFVPLPRDENQMNGGHCGEVVQHITSPFSHHTQLHPIYVRSNSIAHTNEASDSIQAHASSNLSKLSPGGSSVATDEDSGYGRTLYTSSRQAGSNNSIANCTILTTDTSSSGSGLYTRDELLQVMTEDLVDWFTQLYPQLTDDWDVDNFFDRLADGVLLCHHAMQLHQVLVENCTTSAHRGKRRCLNGLRVGGVQATLPDHGPVYQTRGLLTGTASSSFVARDNVSNFLHWCRQLGMTDSVLFESEDLVCRKNPRNVAICLLELARLGGKVGMLVPGLVQLEVEIDAEMLAAQTSPVSPESLPESLDESREVYLRPTEDVSEASTPTDLEQFDDDCSQGEQSISGSGVRKYRTTRSTELRRLKQVGLRAKEEGNSRRKSIKNQEMEEQKKQKPEIKRPIVDMRSLDEIVRDLLSQCTCKHTFPMIRVSEGRYLFGDKSTQIFVRILRSHVMVRVGGGWDTLNHFLAKYDECRKVNPPNCQVPTSNLGSRNGHDKLINPDDKSSILAAVQSSPDSDCYTGGPAIQGQGQLQVIKRSPPRTDLHPTKTPPAPCAMEHLTSTKSSTHIAPHKSNTLTLKGKTTIANGSINSTPLDKHPRRSSTTPLRQSNTMLSATGLKQPQPSIPTSKLTGHSRAHSGYPQSRKASIQSLHTRLPAPGHLDKSISKSTTDLLSLDATIFPKRHELRRPSDMSTCLRNITPPCQNDQQGREKAIKDNDGRRHFQTNPDPESFPQRVPGQRRQSLIPRPLRSSSASRLAPMRMTGISKL